MAIDGDTADFDLDADFTLGFLQPKLRSGPENAYGSGGQHMGIISQFPTDTSTSVAYDIYYVSSFELWEPANSSNELSAIGPLGMALGVNGTTQGFLTHGFVRDSSTISLNAGVTLYLSTNGDFTNTVPTTGYVRIIGYTMYTNTIYFRPDNTYIDL